MKTIQQFKSECRMIIQKIINTKDDGIYANHYKRDVTALLSILETDIPEFGDDIGEPLSLTDNPRIKPDPVNPAHYKGDTVMVFIEEFDLGFCEGNAVKYIARHQSKGTPLEDLRKARWYLDRAISNHETEKNST